MAQVHHLPTPDDEEDEAVLSEESLAALVSWINERYGDGPPEQPPEPEPTYYRHQLLNPDFWFFAAGWFAILLIFTSFIPTNAFEPLLFTGFVLNSIGLVCNLTRDKQGIVVHELRHRWAINLRLPRWLGFGMAHVRRPLVERVEW